MVMWLYATTEDELLLYFSMGRHACDPVNILSPKLSFAFIFSYYYNELVYPCTITIYLQLTNYFTSIQNISGVNCFHFYKQHIWERGEIYCHFFFFFANDVFNFLNSFWNIEIFAKYGFSLLSQTMLFNIKMHTKYLYLNSQAFKIKEFIYFYPFILLIKSFYIDILHTTYSMSIQDILFKT